jgi:hypothetical protein
MTTLINYKIIQKNITILEEVRVEKQGKHLLGV